MLKTCTCQHKAQDELHGNGIRVHTENKDKQLCCTVCGSKPRKEIRLDLHAKSHIKQVHG